MNKKELNIKKILVGICGIGNGHINRQICVIKELLKNNYEVLVATESCKIQMIKDTLKNVKVIELNIPWIVCNEKGFDFKETLDRYNDIDLFRKFLEFGNKIEQELNGTPDLIISDYEPNVAQYAYATSTPLITMEQQSKFLYLDEIKIPNHSIKEEKYRLNYFFPKFNKKIISSFFPLDITDERVLQVPPIISELKKKVTESDFILVYLSPYSNSNKYEELINILSKFKSKKIKIYTKYSNEYENKYGNLCNIEFAPFSEKFKEDLVICESLITTGGHQLISEAISLDIPLYVIPLETYEQHYNAYMVNKYNLGTNEQISNYSIDNFIKNKNKYVLNIKKFKIKYYKKKWEDVFIESIDEIFKNNCKGGKV